MRLPILVATLAVVAAPAALAEAEWQLTLRKQMADEFGCKTDYLSHIVERQIGQRFLVSAKVHCEDKRAFDANWDEAKQRFTVRQCGNVESC